MPNGLSDILNSRVPLTNRAVEPPAYSPAYQPNTSIDFSQYVAQPTSGSPAAVPPATSAAPAVPNPAHGLPVDHSIPLPVPEVTGTSPEFIRSIEEAYPGLGKQLELDRRSQQDRLGSLEAGVAAAQKASDIAEAGYQAETRARLDKQRGALEEHGSDIPTFTEAPPEPLNLEKEVGAPPSAVMRPFGSAKPGEPIFDSLNRTLATLGLVGAMGVGVASGYAQGALASYTGALKGWAEGDQIRAENEWKDYSRKVQQLEKDFNQKVAAWDRAREVHGLDMDTWRAKGVILAAEQGLDKEFIELARRDPELAYEKLKNAQNLASAQRKDLDMQNKTIYDTYMKGVDKREAAKIRAEEMKQRRDEMLQQPLPGGPYIDKTAEFDPATGNFTTEPVVAPSKADYQDFPGRYVKASPQQARMVEMLPTVMPNLNALDETAQRLLAKTSPENIIAGLQGHVSQQLMNDPDWMRFETLTTDLSIELSSVLGTGQFRIGLMQAIQKAAGVDPRMTGQVAHDRIQIMRGQVTNRIQSILGKGQTPLPTSEQTRAEVGGAVAPGTLPPGWKVKVK